MFDRSTWTEEYLKNHSPDLKSLFVNFVVFYNLPEKGAKLQYIDNFLKPFQDRISLFQMATVEFCEDEFNKKAIDFINMSEILSDNWKINEKDKKFYLAKTQTILLKSQQESVVSSDDDDPAAAPQDTRHLISMEYHVLFHPSYQVPALYFIAHSGETSREETWEDTE